MPRATPNQEILEALRRRAQVWAVAGVLIEVGLTVTAAAYILHLWP